MKAAVDQRSITRRIAERIGRIRWTWSNGFRRVLLRRCQLSWCLPSGIRISIESMADWSVYNEVFVDGSYDEAISDAFRSDKNGSTSILDLGANVGFFTLRALDLHRRLHIRSRCRIWQVEAQPQTFKILRQRLLQQELDQPVEEVHSVLGAAGKREGFAFIKENTCHAMAGLNRNGVENGSRVEFVDLEKLVERVDRIDLLKCDIEGSEEMLLEEFAALLARVDRLVIEIHLSECDYSRCLSMIERAGLTRRKVIMETEFLSLEYFTRDRAASQAIPNSTGESK